ncbi:MAG TPA: c-type cytochrome [Propionibacteriaceae bacterium]|nr:c-type cytochrome [Propionibacteriaceae bacterium]
MRLLPRRRRHPVAKPITLLLALFLMGALYAAIAPAQQSSADGNVTTQIAKGKELFQVSCASCHGLNGEGSSQAPMLVGVGAASVDFQVGTGRMPLAKPGAQPIRGKAQYTPDEIAALAAYVASLGSGPAIPSSQQVSTGGLTAQEIARGGELFRTNCSACHNYEGDGGALPNGKYAPPLKGSTPTHIYEAVRTGPYQMPKFSSGVLSDQDVREIIGYLSTLNSQPNNGGLSLGGLGPVSEGLWGWIVGIGSLVLVATWLAKKGARAR